MMSYSYANPRLAEIVGRDAEQIIGYPFTKFVEPSLKSFIENRYKRRIRGDEVPSKYESFFTLSDGSTIYVELNAGLTTFRGKAADLVFIRDMTERKKYELQLVQAKEAAEAASSQISVSCEYEP